jgi:hypothetical protein
MVIELIGIDYSALWGFGNTWAYNRQKPETDEITGYLPQRSLSSLKKLSKSPPLLAA